jgi:hypothetical protein
MLSLLLKQECFEFKHLNTVLPFKNTGYNDLKKLKYNVVPPLENNII